MGRFWPRCIELKLCNWVSLGVLIYNNMMIINNTYFILDICLESASQVFSHTHTHKDIFFLRWGQIWLGFLLSIGWMKYILFWSGVRDNGKKQVEDFKWLSEIKRMGRKISELDRNWCQRTFFLIWMKASNVW